MNIGVEHLRAAVAVAQTGSFTAAARRLGRAQSALSVLIRDLEAELGVRLFDRTTRRVDASAAGRAFIAEAEQALGAFARAIKTGRAQARDAQARLVLAVPPFMVAALLPPLLTRFRGHHPDVAIDLVEAATERIVSAVGGGDADLGIGTFAAHRLGDADVALHRLWNEPLAVLLPGDHVLAGEGPLRWSALRNEALIGQHRDGDERLPVPLTRAAVNITTIVALVEAGLGLGLVPLHAADHARQHGLVARPLGTPTVNRQVSAITRRGRPLSLPAHAFLTLLRARQK